MLTRIVSSAAAGLTITAGLLYLMHYLIEISEAAVTPQREKIDLVWHRTIEDTPIMQDESRPPRPNPPLEEPRNRPPTGLDEEFIPIGPLPVVDTPTGTALRPTAIKNTDGGLMTIVAVQPVYPQAARERGLEGHVIVRFDVTEMGTVSNVVVIESSSRLFNRAAINAAKRFRFKPQIVDGVPQISYGVRRLFTFEMEKN